MIEKRLIDEMVDFLGANVSADLLMKVVHAIGEHTAALRAAIDTPAQAVLCAHKLHGLSATYGLILLAEATGKIECGDATTAELASLVSEVEGAAEETKARLWACANLLRRLV